MFMFDLYKFPVFVTCCQHLPSQQPTPCEGGDAKIVVPQNGWFIMENLLKWMNFWGTTIFGNINM